jgi:hypothetical protein
MSSLKGGGLISRTVREALGTLVSPQLCEQLIAKSLAAQGLDNVPEQGTIIGEWLEGALRAEIEAAVGADAADLVLSQLGPIAAYAAISQPQQQAAAGGRAARAAAPSNALPDFDDDEPDRPTDLRMNPEDTDWSPFGQNPGSATRQRNEPADSDASRRRDPFSDPAVRTLPPARPADQRPANDVAFYTARPQPGTDLKSHRPTTLPFVLTATSDVGDLEALKRYLHGTASVVHIPDLVGLLDTLESGLVEPVVLIDCKRPTVHISSVAALGEDLPRGSTVVLWGADEATWQQIDRDKSPRCRWVRCSREASTADVGSLCSMLIG